MSKQLVKVNKDGMMKVYDEETDKFVLIPIEEQRNANYVHQQLVMGALMMAIGISKMFNEKLYLALGYSSRDEYIDLGLPIGRTQAYRLYTIGMKFTATEKLLTDDGNVISLMKQLPAPGQISPINGTEGIENEPNNEELKSNAAKILGFGMTKLFELSSLEDDELAKLIKTGKVSLAGGDLTIDDVIDTTTKELSKKLREMKSKYQGETTRLTEEVRLLESEQKSRSKEFERMATENKNAKRVEAMYGPKASLIKDKVERLGEARVCLQEFSQILRNCGVDENDPKEIRDDLLSLLKLISSTHEDLTMEYEPVVAQGL